MQKFGIEIEKILWNFKSKITNLFKKSMKEYVKPCN